MRIALGSDHAGFDIKEEIRLELRKRGYTVLDKGCHGKEPADYPDYAHQVAAAVADGEAERGILVCSTGIGMSIAANRRAGVRAALCHNCDTAYFARTHNDANILTLGARYVTFLDARAIVEVFLGTRFSGSDRHRRRIDKIESCEAPA